MGYPLDPQYPVVHLHRTKEDKLTDTKDPTLGSENQINKTKIYKTTKQSSIVRLQFLLPMKWPFCGQRRHSSAADHRPSLVFDPSQLG